MDNNVHHNFQKAHYHFQKWKESLCPSFEEEAGLVCL